MEQQNPLVGDSRTCLEREAASLSQRAHHWEARMKLAVPMAANFPGLASSFMGWGALKEQQLRTMARVSRPKEGRQCSDAPSPCTARREWRVSGIINCMRLWIWELHGMKRHEV